MINEIVKEERNKFSGRVSAQLLINELYEALELLLQQNQHFYFLFYFFLSSPIYSKNSRILPNSVRSLGF